MSTPPLWLKNTKTVRFQSSVSPDVRANVKVGRISSNAQSELVSTLIAPFAFLLASAALLLGGHVAGQLGLLASFAVILMRLNTYRAIPAHQRYRALTSELTLGLPGSSFVLVTRESSNGVEPRLMRSILVSEGEWVQTLAFPRSEAEAALSRTYDPFTATLVVSEVEDFIDELHRSGKSKSRKLASATC